MEKIKSRRAIPVFILCAVLDALLTWKFFRYFNFPAYLLAPAALVLGWAMARTVLALRLKRGGRLPVLCAVSACLLSAAFVVGGKVDTTKRLFAPPYRSDLIYLAVLAAVFFFVLCWLADAAAFHPIRLRAKPPFAPKAVWLFCAVFFFLCWIPCLAVYFPGSISPDSLACIVRATGQTGLSNQQPVFYILLMRPFLLFALTVGRGLNFGAALFLAFQAAVMAVMLGYLPCWLTKKGFPLWAVGLTAAYFVLIPVFPLYASTMWKDILFGGVMMLYVLHLFDTMQSKGEWLSDRRHLVWFVALNVLISFLRNNGYYIVFLTLIVLVLIFRRNWKRLAPAFLAVIIAVPVIQGPVYHAAGVAPSPFAESVGIPLQQIGYTVAHGGSMTKEQADFLNRMLPLGEMKKAYSPFSSNDIKFHKDFNNEFLEHNKGTFLKVWAEMFPANAKSYCKAYVMQTLGYWHPGTTGWVVYDGIRKGYGAEKSGLVMTDPMHLSGNRAAVYHAFSALQTEIPALSMLVNIGWLFWFTVFAAFLCILRRKWNLLPAFLPLFLLWATLMIATPVYCEFRYMFAFATCLPAVLLTAFPSAEPPVPEEEPAAENA